MDIICVRMFFHKMCHSETTKVASGKNVKSKMCHSETTKVASGKKVKSETLGPLSSWILVQQNLWAHDPTFCCAAEILCHLGFVLSRTKALKSSKNWSFGFRLPVLKMCHSETTKVVSGKNLKSKMCHSETTKVASGKKVKSKILGRLSSWILVQQNQWVHDPTFCCAAENLCHLGFVLSRTKALKSLRKMVFWFSASGAQDVSLREHKSA